MSNRDVRKLSKRYFQREFIYIYIYMIYIYIYIYLYIYIYYICYICFIYIHIISDSNIYLVIVFADIHLRSRHGGSHTAPAARGAASLAISMGTARLDLECLLALRSFRRKSLDLLWPRLCAADAARNGNAGQLTLN